MATLQMNVRMDSATKPAGDEALASIGYTPSGIVHAIWNYASRNRHNRDALRSLRKLLEPTEADKTAEAHSWVASGPSIYKNILLSMCIEASPAPLQQSDDDLLLQAHLDKMAEREDAE